MKEKRKTPAIKKSHDGLLKGQDQHTEGIQWKGIPSESITLVMVITQCKLQVLLITWAYTISFNKAQADGSAGNSEAEMGVFNTSSRKCSLRRYDPWKDWTFNT